MIRGPRRTWLGREYRQHDNRSWLRTGVILGLLIASLLPYAVIFASVLVLFITLTGLAFMSVGVSDVPLTSWELFGLLLPSIPASFVALAATYFAAWMLNTRPAIEGRGR